MFLAVIAVLSMTMAFAEDEHLENVNNVNAFKMEVNYSKLGEALSLTRDQMEAVKDIHQAFCADMMSVAAASKDSQKAMLKNAISKDLGFMRIVLNEKQYKLYLRLLNTTINNRGLNVQYAN